MTLANLQNYDVLLYFRHYQISQTAQDAIRDYIEGGGGLVALHHAIYNHQNGNDTLIDLIGGELPFGVSLDDENGLVYDDESNHTINVNLGHFTSTLGVHLLITQTVDYTSPLGLPNANLDNDDQRGTYSFRIEAPDELYLAEPAPTWGRLAAGPLWLPRWPMSLFICRAFLSEFKKVSTQLIRRTDSMDSPEIHLPHNHQAVTNRFVAACQADERVVAAFLGGSYAKGAADAHSDLDLYLITTDAAYEAFCADRETFIRLLGEPLFLEDFGASHGLFYMFSDDTEGELWIGRESHFTHIHGGPYRVLLDKQGILAGVVFPAHEADQAEQSETLRQLIMVFWHDLSHFIKAMGRGQLWFAYGQLEVLRHMCVNLARLRHNFADAGVGEEPYFKIEEAIPIEQLAPLQATYCQMEPDAMRQAGHIILRFYHQTASSLAQTHGIPFPADLERLMVARLEQLEEDNIAPN